MAHAIVMRPLDFEFDPARLPAAWYAGDLYLTLFMDALSLLFPDGERFFVDSVKRYRERIDDAQLAADVAGFIGQEAMHGRAHRALNETLTAHGLDVAPLAAQVRALLDRVRRRAPARSQLAATCALEHFTAILAEQLLRRDDQQQAIDPSVRRLWLWHAFEESEHKTVAFDVYRAIGGGEARRLAVMALTTVIFFAEHFYLHVKLLAARRLLFSPRAWLRGLGHLWIRPGLLRRLIPAYLAYYRPGFHPSDRDTSALLAEWRARFDGAEVTS